MHECVKADADILFEFFGLWDGCRCGAPPSTSLRAPPFDGAQGIAFDGAQGIAFDGAQGIAGGSPRNGLPTRQKIKKIAAVD